MDKKKLYDKGWGHVVPWGIFQLLYKRLTVVITDEMNAMEIRIAVKKLVQRKLAALFRFPSY